MYKFVCRYVNSEGFDVVMPCCEGQSIDEALREVGDGQAIFIEKIDHEAIFNKFLNWMDKVTDCHWFIEDMSATDVSNWLRYNDIDYYEYLIVAEMLEKKQQEE